MTEQTLTAREQHTLEHLRQAEELGVSLEYYATAYELNLQQLLSGKAQLERKGLWPRNTPPAKVAVSAARPELLAVHVLAEASAPAKAAATTAPSERLRCRLIAPTGWVLECDHWPEAPWLAALVGAAR